MFVSVVLLRGYHRNALFLQPTKVVYNTGMIFLGYIFLRLKVRFYCGEYICLLCDMLNKGNKII